MSIIAESFENLTLCTGSDLTRELEKWSMSIFLSNLYLERTKIYLYIDILVSLHFAIYHYVKPRQKPTMFLRILLRLFCKLV